MPICPVCSSGNCVFFCQKKNTGQRCYKCADCGLYFVFPHESIYVSATIMAALGKERVTEGGSAHDNYTRWRDRETTLMAEMAVSGLPGGKLLEVAFGEYPTCRFVESRGFEWFGIEPDSPSFEAAQIRLTSNRSKAFQLGVEDLETAAPFSTMNGHFDVIIFLNAIHVIPEPRKALHSFHRLLSPHGRLVIAMADASGFYLTAWIRRLTGMEPWAYSVISFFDANNIRMLFEKSGFRIAQFMVMPMVSPLSIEYLYRQHNSLLLKWGLHLFRLLRIDRILRLNTFFIILEKSPGS